MSEERELRIRGQVQGVGFRPFVFRLAAQEGVLGAVWNDPAGVTLLVQGGSEALDRLLDRLREQPPPLARIDDVEVRYRGVPRERFVRFEIRESLGSTEARGRVALDSATCPDCVRELFDPRDRRHGHALINCTNCGPRYTILSGLPYDRARTTMRDFGMCPDCAREYGDPADRRFHAQPVCCPNCGPRLQLVDGAGALRSGDPIKESAALLRRGEALAMKGLGGYHLVVDACNAAAVAALRSAKRRRAKPFALMFPDLESARRHVELSELAASALLSPRSPIVLARIRDLGDIAEDVPARTHRLGVMLPYTPMQHLLLRRFDAPLVMTSANEHGDPLLTDDAEVRALLAPEIRHFLQHDRPIERAVDDSIVLDASFGLLPIRRARGYVPEPLPLPVAAPSDGLATGADLKNAVAIVHGDQCVLGQHVGDLEHARAHERFVRTLSDLERLWELGASWVASDLHPGYLSTQHAEQLADDRALQLLGIQHHHAHLAALLAEHGRTGPIVALVCDGVGYGSDGAAWGGEVLVGDLRTCSRVGRVRPLRLPGGDVAARRCGRVALSWIHDALGPEAARRYGARVLPEAEERSGVLAMLERDLHCPWSSGLGRYFDAAAALLGVTLENEYEAQSGMLLESLASRATGADFASLPIAERDDGLRELDTGPLLTGLLRGGDAGVERAELARSFHDALADGLARLALEVAEGAGSRSIGLSGGVFCNERLTVRIVDALEDAGYGVLLHRLVPPNDGGVAYGQAAVAAARLAAD